MKQANDSKFVTLMEKGGGTRGWRVGFCMLVDARLLLAEGCVRAFNSIRCARGRRLTH